MLHAQTFIHTQLVPHREHCLNYKYQREKVLVDVRRFSRNCITLSYFNHYWNGSIKFRHYLRYGVYRKYVSLGRFDRCSRTIHQMKIVQLGHAHKMYGDMRDKCTCLVEKLEGNRRACLKGFVSYCGIVLKQTTNVWNLFTTFRIGSCGGMPFTLPWTLVI